jgi:hypothetical protein
MKHKNGKSNIDILKDYVAGVRPFVQVGYTGKKYVKRKVGERWTDKGIEWEQKETGPQRVNRVADVVREARGNEQCKCGQEIRWGSKADQIFYRRTGMCSECVINYETNLRIAGLWNEYEKYKLISNEIGFLKDAEANIAETVKFFSENSGDITAICNSEGFTERWKNTNRDQILEDAKRDLERARNRIAILEPLKEGWKNKFIEGAKQWNLETYV